MVNAEPRYKMWFDEWSAISARVQSLLEAGAFFLRSNDTEMGNASNYLIENAHDTVYKIRAFDATFKHELQNEQRESIVLFLARYKNDLMPPHGSPSGFSGVTSVVAYLASFRAEFEYLSRDATAITRSLVVRAFTHLQRTIVVDDFTRNMWQKKFSDGETACEALGSCHLLLHGIWAFKTSAEGERTDLILGKPLDVTSGDLQRASVGLILTEWKVVRSDSELPGKLEDAYQQAKRYRQGILAGFEVASPRYLIIVSKDHVEMPSPREDGNVTYEYRNIAVSPSSPSNSARIQRKSKSGHRKSKPGNAKSKPRNTQKSDIIHE